jgi:hypothetical protein
MPPAQDLRSRANAKLRQSHAVPLIGELQDLMLRFSERTAGSDSAPPQRYLWTDAFAVCNWLTLARATGDAQHLASARALVDEVHRVLGRHRADDGREGWISGLGEEEGARQPTHGGLRIGKPFPERSADERFDPDLEWDRDGQYFHYLTKWIHALDQLARATGNVTFHHWAVELMIAAHQAFCRFEPRTSRPRMAWKMSIDLSRPLVSSAGHHDPLDGYITCAQLEATSAEFGSGAKTPNLAVAKDFFAALLVDAKWATTDMLGLGGLLMDTHRAAQLSTRGPFVAPTLVETLLSASLESLRDLAVARALGRPPHVRLPFREFGLAIGLAAAESMISEPLSGRLKRDFPELTALLSDVACYVPLRETILTTWHAASAQRSQLWMDHRDINEVMLATALAPAGVLVLHPLAEKLTPSKA